MLRLRETTASTMWGTGSISQQGLLEEGRFKTPALSPASQTSGLQGWAGDNILWHRPSLLLIAFCDRNTPES